MSSNLNREQQHILSRIVAIGRRMHASPKELKAAVETGLVETNLRNLPGGDADSAGWRQERASLYPDPTNLNDSITRFFNETHAVRGKYPRAGDLAAAVQRPAAQYRGRYQQRAGDAAALLGQLGAAGGGGGNTSAPVAAGGVDNTAARGALIASFLNDGDSRFTQGTAAAGSETSDPVKFALALRNLASTAAPAASNPATRAQPAPQATPADDSQGGVASFDGKQVAAWIAPILKYARRQGWTGTVSSGYRTDAEQTRIYDSGVRPAARPKSEGGSGSNHEGTVFPLGAVDVSQEQQLAQILARSPYAKKLVWAGAKDHVHFSHPHDGGY